MKNKLLSIINIIIILGIFAFVLIYSHFEQINNYQNQIVNFENMTVAMESITENYLEGEQRICNVWANYINSQHMTLDEASDFIRSSHVSTNTMAHLVYVDNLNGLSTKSDSHDNYNVSYENVGLLDNLNWISNDYEAINISRAYTNPINGKQSLAFINKIQVYDSITDEQKEALLLRIVLVSELEDKWVFPQQEFKKAELSLINNNGDYIIKGNSYKSNNFYEFYKSYNEISNANLQNLKTETSKETGYFMMKNSKGNNCVIAHTPVVVTNGWIMLNYINDSELSSRASNWLLVGASSIGLLLLLLANSVYMRLTNKRLHQMALAAESANKAKTDFLSTMSHDIRTPMNAIIGLTTIAQKKIDEKETVKDNLHKISLASNHLLTLINDVLDISKVESGKLSLNPLPFSIVETTDTLVNISHQMIKDKGLNFNFRISHVDKEFLYADQIRLSQIYINILSNAIKYTPSGGTVSVDLRQQDSEKEGYVKLTYVVADNGIGMSEEYMKSMYLPFSRQTDSRVNSIQGTGLGLAITKKMVDLMEGTIDCVSKEGVGTTFTVTIDLKVADKQYESMHLDPVDVLIIDDDEVLLETACDTLESLGVSAQKADSGAKAIELVSERKESNNMFGVIIVDWKMKEMDGIETVHKIREIIGKSTPIILISAYDWSDVEKVVNDPCISGFISKPLFKSTLYNKISELLSKDAKIAENEDDYSDIAGVSALIAEDNDINWEIIHMLLEMHGVSSERAENGKICIQKLEEAKDNQFDLIFMDIQMPEMNGLDATRTIRKLSNPNKANIPIVAMTADAFSENVAECINAGMNGHIAKPIDIKLVIKEIRRIKEKKQ